MKQSKMKQEIVLQDETLRSESTPPGEEPRTSTNITVTNDSTGLKPNVFLEADVHRGERKVQCCAKHAIRAWKMGSMNQGRLETVKQAREYLNITVLCVSKLEWTEMGHFQSDKYNVFYSGNDKLRRN